MTTQPTQPEAAQPPLTDRVSKLEGIAEQVNERLAENTQALNTLRTENQAEHQAMRAENHAEFQSLRAENQGLREEINRLRADMNRQMVIVIGVLGGLMALFNFVG